MPTKRSRIGRGRRSLTLDQRYFLRTGLYLDGTGAKERFRDRKAIEAAWRIHGPAITEQWKAEGRPGRPWAHWFCDFELGELDENLECLDSRFDDVGFPDQGHEE